MKFRRLLTGLFLLSCLGQAWAAPLAPTRARIIDSFEQLGIDVAKPRFGWVDNADGRGEMQSAYQIVVARSEADLEANRNTVWDSGKVASAEQYGIAYAGPALEKTAKYWWKVRFWNQNDQLSPWSDPASFGTGFFSLGDWDPKGAWIMTPPVDPKTRPMPMFRKTFQVAGPVKNAYLYVTGLGQFVASLNGQKVGNHEIDPAWTDYDQTVDYATFDVTSMLQPGPNAIGVMLGTGFLDRYSNSGFRDFGPFRMKAQLHIEYADGRSEELVSDTSWKTAPSPFSFAEFHAQEDYDARQEQPGWNTANFDDASWADVVVAPAPKGALVAQSAPPVMVRKEYTPVKVTNPAPHVYVYDFGQNFNGQYEITVSGKAGSKVQMIAGETLNGDGTVNEGTFIKFERRGIRGSTYTLKGEGDETWRVTFASLGFRYLQLSPVAKGAPSGEFPGVKEVKGYFVATGSREVGSFKSSDERDNRIHDLAMMTMENNYTSIHTDGANVEKLGWQEVTWIAPISAMYKFDLQNFSHKVARDLRDAQRDCGLNPDVAPNWFRVKATGSSGPYDDAPAWGASAFLVPWTTYLVYGDTQILEGNYEAMKKYLAFLKSKETPEGIINYGLGDWFAPSATTTALPAPDMPNTEGAVYVYDTRVMRDIARALGREEDAKRYGEEFERVRAAYNKAYYKPETHQYFPVTQTNLVLPLAFGIVPDGEEKAVFDALVSEIHKPASPSTKGHYGPVSPDHLTTGDIATTFLWQVLGDGGKSDLVQTMITQPSWPSYMYMLNNGETTITEHWNSLQARSHDHDMYAGIGGWFYRSLGGIAPTKPGYEEFRIKPDLSADLKDVDVSYESVRGTIASAWTQASGSLELKVTVPVNSTATVYVPAADAGSVREGGLPVKEAPGVKFLRMEGSAAVFSVGSGSYTFQSDLPSGQ